MRYFRFFCQLPLTASGFGCCLKQKKLTWFFLHSYLKWGKFVSVELGSTQKSPARTPTKIYIPLEAPAVTAEESPRTAALASNKPPEASQVTDKNPHETTQLNEGVGSTNADGITQEVANVHETSLSPGVLTIQETTFEESRVTCFFALWRRRISTSKIWKLGSFRWSYCFQRSWQTIWWLSISFLSGFFSFRIIHLDFLIVVLSGFPDSLIRSTLWCWLLNSWKFPSFLSIPWNNLSLYVFRLFSEGKYGNIKAHWLRSTILARYKQNYNQYQKTA